MARKSRTNEYKHGFSERLGVLMRDHLKLDVNSLAKLLGHSSTSTLRNAMIGLGGFDIERLGTLGQLKTPSGARPNLDWLLTGRGVPLLIEADESEHSWQVWLSTERKIALKVLSETPLPKF